ncbi:MAG: hypothetical protein NTZ25_00750 [Candidatus Peregrinibacteria bacterium]|nr:hypothetical protein [Candidatus Peregrinibacteria bacterium]
MPEYKKGDEKKFFPTAIAALIVAAIAIASFIYSVVKTGDNAKVTQPSNNSPVMKLNPGAGVQTPTTAPSVPSPTTPPPAN